jgi:SNF2 family DNA or RNA helicase
MEFYPFQQRGLDQTEQFNRVAYYWDMGLGKTYVGAEKAVQLNAPVILVVCQKSKIQDWIDHFIQNYDIAAADLTNKCDFEWFFNRPWHGVTAEPERLKIGVINYDLIFRRRDFLNLENFTLLLDESSQIQNEKAKRTKFILKMNPLNVILLSGTPTSGKYENLWAQLNLIGWEISQRVYNTQYVNWKKIEVGGFPMNVVNKDDPYKNVDRLKRKMREHGAVFLKTDEVFELPKQNFIEVNVSTTKEYRKFQKTKVVTVDGQEFIGDTALTQRLYSRMLCGHLNPAKLDAFRDLCESTNDRLIVFYNFNDELHALRQIAVELDKPVSEVNGHTKDLTAYEQYENSITLIQYQAGAMGLNLQKANKIIYFTPTDKSELFEQSKKRIHRIGQDKPCFYWLMVCKNSVEDKEIFPILGLRKQLTDDLFVDGKETK